MSLLKGSENAASERNSYRYLKRIFSDHSKGEKAKADDSYLDALAATSALNVRPTKFCMNAPKPMVYEAAKQANASEEEKDREDKQLQQIYARLLNSQTNIVREEDPQNNNGAAHSTLLLNDDGANDADAINDSAKHLKEAWLSSSEIFRELKERKDAMHNHYRCHYGAKYILICYLGAVILIFCILLMHQGQNFNDSALYATQHPQAWSYALQLPEICEFEYSSSPDTGYNYKSYQDWKEDGNDDASIDSHQWIILSVIGFLLCFSVHSVWLLCESFLLISRFDYFARYGIDPLFCSKYVYPNSHHLTSALDPDSFFFVHSESPKQSGTIHIDDCTKF